MQNVTQERWRQLCEQASTEQDSEKLAELIKEINDLLEARKDQLSKANSRSLGARGENQLPIR